MQTMRSKVEQCKKDLIEERGRCSKLLEKNEELRLAQGIDVERHYRAEEMQR